MKLQLKFIAKIACASTLLIFASCSSEDEKKIEDEKDPTIEIPAPGAPSATPPTVSTISPSSGTKGTLVTLTGTGFSTDFNGNVVTLNGKACQVYSNSTTTELKIIIPKEARSGKITISIANLSTETSIFNYILSSDISTIAGTTRGDSNIGLGQFNAPEDIALDAAGNIYLADTKNHKIKKISSTGVITTLAGSTQGDSNTGIGQLNTPTGVAVDPSGNVYFVDLFNHKVKKISTSGIISTIAGSTQGDSNVGIGQLYNPSHIVIDKSGNIYVTDNGNSKIKKILTTGEIITFFETKTFEITNVRGICIDSANNIFIVDNNQIKKITQNKTITTLVGGLVNTGGDSNEGTGLFYGLNGLTIDSADNLYVADANNSKIKKITPTGIITTYSEGTIPNYDNTGRALLTPFGVALDSNGNAYVASGAGNCIKKIIYN